MNHIHYRRVILKQGIDRVQDGQLTFSDGTSEPFDHLISATGYEIELDFLPDWLVRRDRYTMDLYLRIVPPDWRGLYFLGFFNSDTALNWIAQDQARWIAAHETGEAALPSRTEMEDEIAQRRARVRAEFKDTPRHGIEVEHLPYFRDLKKSLKAARQRTQ